MFWFEAQMFAKNDRYIFQWIMDSWSQWHSSYVDLMRTSDKLKLSLASN